MKKVLIISLLLIGCSNEFKGFEQSPTPTPDIYLVATQEAKISEQKDNFARMARESRDKREEQEKRNAIAQATAIANQKIKDNIAQATATAEREEQEKRNAIAQATATAEREEQEKRNAIARATATAELKKGVQNFAEYGSNLFENIFKKSKNIVESFGNEDSYKQKYINKTLNEFSILGDSFSYEAKYGFADCTWNTLRQIGYSSNEIEDGIALYLPPEKYKEFQKNRTNITKYCILETPKMLEEYEKFILNTATEAIEMQNNLSKIFENLY